MGALQTRLTLRPAHDALRTGFASSRLHGGANQLAYYEVGRATIACLLGVASSVEDNVDECRCISSALRKQFRTFLIVREQEGPIELMPSLLKFVLATTKSRCHAKSNATGAPPERVKLGSKFAKGPRS